MTKTFTEFAEEKLGRSLTVQEKAFIKYMEAHPETHLKFPNDMKRLDGLRHAYKYFKKKGDDWV